MQTWQWVALALGATVVFWMLGAYNRLVGLRNEVGAAWKRADEALQERQRAARALLAQLAEPLAGERGALEAMAAANDAVEAAAREMGEHPMRAPAAQALVQAEAAWSAAAARVLALLAQHAGAMADAEVLDERRRLRDADARLVFGRQIFNQASETYNGAARQLPTRLLTRLYGFGTAGRL